MDPAEAVAVTEGGIISTTTTGMAASGSLGDVGQHQVTRFNELWRRLGAHQGAIDVDLDGIAALRFAVELAHLWLDEHGAECYGASTREQPDRGGLGRSVTER